MGPTNSTSKMSDRKRLLRYVRRKATWMAALAVLAGLVVLADRTGMLGARPEGDFEKYHGKLFRVVQVIDGDTFDVAVRDGKWPNTRIRLWGVDTPETTRPDTPPQHFGPEASSFTKRLCAKKIMRLELLESDTRGLHGRLLAYAYLPDGRMLNRLLVAEGYAYADPRFDHPRQREFRSLQRQAKDARKGLWREAARGDLPYYYRDLALPKKEQDGRAER